jgi:hypothetical protein
MFRFLFNFVFFGLLFYVIWKFYPEAFTQLVTWAETLYQFLVTFGEKLWHMINEATKPDATKEAETIFRMWIQ